MNLNGHTNLKTSSAGVVVHPEKWCLGASPDACVIDPSVPLTTE